MDSNSFYPMLISAFLPLIIKVISPVFLDHEMTKRKKLFRMYKKVESSNFYLYIVFAEFAVVILCVCLINLLCEIIKLIVIKIGFELVIEANIRVVLFAVMSIWLSMQTTKSRWIRKRLLGDQKGRMIIICSIVCLNFSLFFGMVKVGGSVLSFFCAVIYFFLEIIGLLYFEGRYIKFAYSSVKIYSNSGQAFECENIENLVIKNKYIMIRRTENCFILQYREICNVEFYGPPKYLLLESSFDKIKKRYSTKRTNQNR